MIIYKEKNKYKGEVYYVSYPISKVIFTIEDIESLLMIFANSGGENNKFVLDVLSLFREYEHLKKGKSNEVVLKGNELFESFLSQNFESGFVSSDAESN